LTLCVVHDGASEDALIELVNGASINGRAVTVSKGARSPRFARATCSISPMSTPTP
jgi:hypothetical protein